MAAAGIKGSRIDPEDLIEMCLQQLEWFVKKVIASHSKLLTLFKGTSGQHQNSPRNFCRLALSRASTTTSMSELTLYYYHYKTVGIPDYEGKFITSMDAILKGSSNTIADQLGAEQLSSKTSTPAIAVAAAATFKDMNATFKDYAENTKIYQKVCMENMLLDNKKLVLDNMSVNKKLLLDNMSVADKLYKKYMEAKVMLSNVQTGETEVPLTLEEKEEQIFIFSRKILSYVERSRRGVEAITK